VTDPDWKTNNRWKWQDGQVAIKFIPFKDKPFARGDWETDREGDIAKDSKNGWYVWRAREITLIKQNENTTFAFRLMVLDGVDDITNGTSGTGRRPFPLPWGKENENIREVKWNLIIRDDAQPVSKPDEDELKDKRMWKQVETKCREARSTKAREVPALTEARAAASEIKDKELQKKAYKHIEDCPTMDADLLKKVYDKCQEARGTPKRAAELIAEAKGFAGEIQNTEMLTKAENAITYADNTSKGK
jgi:hypothetical protein